MPIHNQTEALAQFCEAATQQAAATETGDSRLGNKAYHQIVEAAQWLAARQALTVLRPLLLSDAVGIRLWAAAVLLPHHPTEAEETLAALATSASIHGFMAATTLGEWQAGRLRPLA